MSDPNPSLAQPFLSIQNTHQNSALDFIGQRGCEVRMREGGSQNETVFFITSETVSRLAHASVSMVKVSTEIHVLFFFLIEKTNYWKTSL